MTDQALSIDGSSGPQRGRRLPLGRTLVIVALALAVGVSLLAPGLALHWIKQPFLGILLEHTLVVAGRASVGWTGEAAGLNHPDRVLSIDGVPVTRSADLLAELRRHEIGDVVLLKVEGPDGTGGWQTHQVSISLMRFPLQDLVTRFLVAYVVGLIYLALGIWVFIVKGHRTSGRSFAFFCAFLSLTTVSYFDLTSTHWLTRIFAAAMPFCAASVIHLALVFPQERTIIGRWRVLHYLPYPVALVIAVWSQVVLFDAADPRAYFVAWRWSYYYIGLAAVMFLGLLHWTWVRPATLEIRHQTRIVLVGSIAAFAPFLIWVVVSTVLSLDFEFQASLFLLPLVLFPLSVAYAIVRHRLLDVNLVISRGLVYLVLTTLIAGGYFLMLNLVGRATELVAHPAVMALFVLILVLFLDPLRRRTQRLVDRIFYKDRPHYRQELQDFSRMLTATLDLPRLLDMFLDRVGTLMHAEQGIVYLFDPQTNEYTVQHTWRIPHSDTLTAVRFRDRDATVKWLKTSLGALYLTGSEGRLRPADLSDEERARLTVLQATLCVPFFVKGQLIGWLALGPRLTRDLYSPDDLAFLTGLADQTAMAIENARLFEQSEGRARELGILNQVGQTITSTLDLTSVLNLIMSKVVELLNVEAGSLLMLDETGENQVFRVALGPVKDQIERSRMPVGTGIAGRTAREGQPYIVADARTDPRWYSVFDEDTGFSTQNILAVPLSVKGKTIGVIEAINKRNGRPFTKDEQTLLTSFASQAAIAIENARLFTQTDQALAERVAELSMMQAIDRQLNATLDLERVMNLGLEWAMRTTDAASGIIATMTPDQDSLHLVVVKSYSSELLDYQDNAWPLDQGIVGRVARTGEPALVRDVSQDSDYVKIASDTRSQLSVPILCEGAVIGIISLESRDVAAFDEADVSFVQRLADRIAIAMTNARLYADVKAANEAKSEFVSMVSHELKTPMTSIKGYARLLQMGSGGEISEKQRSYLNIINTSVDRMDALVQDLLDISRIETGRLKLVLEPVRLTIVVDDIVRLLGHEFEARQQTLSIDVPRTLPPVRADRMRLAQVLTNLLSNAYKYTLNGGSVGVRAEVQDGSVLCSVADTGIGISPRDQKKIFQKFFRADQEFVRQAGGTGLGLSIAKSIVELQGGEMWFESEPGQGSTFSFTVPLA